MGASFLALVPHILVVDDDTRLRGLLGRYLSEQGFVVATSKDAEDARTKLKNMSFDLMVLDVMMPGENGFELTRSLQGSGAKGTLPILLLTAKGETDDRIHGLEAGADDYLMKPFEPKELLLRINAILRRTGRAKDSVKEVLRLGAWTYDPERDELRSGGEVIVLTGMEAALMKALASVRGQVLSREALVDQSAAGQAINDRTIDVQVTRLRRKIEPDVKNPRYLITVRGEGYSLRPDAL